ncbi:MAG: ATP-binding cassette domain-containing protein, partial [Christensenellaceae bacterium]
MKALEFENIEYTYKGGTYALKGVNLSVEEGEFVAVLGRNGSGKSTLARLADYLLRVDEGEDEENVSDKANEEASDKKTIEDPFGEGGREVRQNSGFVRVFGMTAEEFEREESRRIEEGKNPRDRMDGIAYVRSHVGIVFQNPDNQTVTSIVEDDVAFGPENMGVPREEIEKRVTEALDAVGMLEYRDRMISSLSGGQKQRVAIAGVLALRPRIMIFDESTAMLDPKGRREIMSVVRKLNRE